MNRNNFIFMLFIAISIALTNVYFDTDNFSPFTRILISAVAAGIGGGLAGLVNHLISLKQTKEPNNTFMDEDTAFAETATTQSEYHVEPRYEPVDAAKTKNSRIKNAPSAIVIVICIIGVLGWNAYQTDRNKKTLALQEELSETELKSVLIRGAQGLDIPATYYDEHKYGRYAELLTFVHDASYKLSELIQENNQFVADINPSSFLTEAMLKDGASLEVMSSQLTKYEVGTNDFFTKKEAIVKELYRSIESSSLPADVIKDFNRNMMDSYNSTNATSKQILQDYIFYHREILRLLQGIQGGYTFENGTILFNSDDDVSEYNKNIDNINKAISDSQSQSAKLASAQ